MDFYTIRGQKDNPRLWRAKKECGYVVKVGGENFYCYKRCGTNGEKTVYVIDPKIGLSVYKIPFKMIIDFDKLYKDLCEKINWIRKYKKTESYKHAIKDYKKYKKETIKNKAARLPR